MNSRSHARLHHRIDAAIRAIPYVLSVSTMIFAVACAKGDDKEKVDARAREARKGAPTAPESLELAKRIEGGSVFVTPAPDEKGMKAFKVRLSLLVASGVKDKPSMQLHAAGQAFVGIEREFAKASKDKDVARMNELRRMATLTVDGAESSVEAIGRFRAQVNCASPDCSGLLVQLSEADGAEAIVKTGAEASEDEAMSRYKRLIVILFKAEGAMSASGAPMRIAEYRFGDAQELRGADKQKVDPAALSKKTFEEALQARADKPASVSPAAKAAADAKPSAESKKPGANAGEKPAGEAEKADDAESTDSKESEKSAEKSADGGGDEKDAETTGLIPVED